MTTDDDPGDDDPRTLLHEGLETDVPALLAECLFYWDYDWDDPFDPMPWQAERQRRLWEALERRVSPALLAWARRTLEARNFQHTSDHDPMTGFTDDEHFMEDSRPFAAPEGELDLHAFGLACLDWTQYDAARFCVRVGVPVLDVLRKCIHEGERGPRLRIRELGLSSLPPSIGELDELVELSVDDGALRALPPEIGRLSRLSALDLHLQRLDDALPDQLSAVPLDDLSLRGALREVPDILFSLSGLRRLKIKVFDYHKQWRQPSFPAALGRLTELRELHIDCERLQALPDTLGHLERLTRLIVESNRIQLADSICDLAALEHLEVGSAAAKITHLPSRIHRLTRLKTLHVNGLAAPHVPEPLLSMSHLDELVLAYCAQKLPEEEVAALRRSLPRTEVRVY